MHATKKSSMSQLGSRGLNVERTVQSLVAENTVYKLIDQHLEDDVVVDSICRDLQVSIRLLGTRSVMPTVRHAFSV